MRSTKAIAFVFVLLCLCSCALSAQVWPGKTPPPQCFEIRMRAGFVFASPDYRARADLENPANSGLLLKHTLTITPEELRRVAGVVLPDQAEDEAIVLFEGELMQPGKTRDTFALSTLPDGRSLPEGLYEASMWIDLFNLTTGETLNSRYRVKCDIVMMSYTMDARVHPNGSIHMVAHNAATAPARLALLISTQVPGAAHGIDNSVFGTENSFALLALSDVIEANASSREPLALAALPDGSTIPPGTYCTYLLRIPVDSSRPPCAVAQVFLNVAAGTRAALPALSIAQTDQLPYAQAVVDCVHLLSLGGKK